jgi:hypothetical protein
LPHLAEVLISKSLLLLALGQNLPALPLCWLRCGVQVAAAVVVVAEELVLVVLPVLAVRMLIVCSKHLI